MENRVNFPRIWKKVEKLENFTIFPMKSLNLVKQLKLHSGAEEPLKF